MKQALRYVGYVLTGALVLFTYLMTRDYMIGTPPGKVVVSNLTVNYVLMACLTGGFSGWYCYNRLLRKQSVFLRMIGTALLEFVVAILWLSVMSMGGYQVRWG